jgi:hypothetical protein
MTVFESGREKWRVADDIRAHGWAISSVSGENRDKAVEEIQKMLWDIPISYVWSGDDTFVDQRRWSWNKDHWSGFGGIYDEDKKYTPQLHGVPTGDPSLQPPDQSNED